MCPNITNVSFAITRSKKLIIFPLIKIKQKNGLSEIISASLRFLATINSNGKMRVFSPIGRKNNLKILG